MATQLVNLKDGSNYLVPKVFTAIDFDNLLESGSTNNQYTIQHNGFVYLMMHEQLRVAYINGLNILKNPKSEYDYAVIIPCKIGDVISTNYSVEYQVYGIKYSNN